MPVAAIALGAMSFAGGLAALGTAATLAGTIAAGAMMVGGTLTVIGGLTGNAKLTKIGGILSLAGGLGTMAFGGGAEAAAGSTASTTAGEGAAAAGSVAGDVAASGMGELATAGVETAAVAAPEVTTTALAEVGTGGSASIAGPMTDVQAQGMLNAQAASAPAMPIQASTTAAPTSTAAAGTELGQNAMVNTSAAGTEVGQAGQTQAFSDANFDAMNKMSPEWTGSGSATASASDPGMYAKFMAWTKANPEMAKMVMEGGKGMLGNLVTSPKDQAYIDYYKQNSEALKRKALWATGRMA